LFKHTKYFFSLKYSHEYYYFFYQIQIQEVYFNKKMQLIYFYGVYLKFSDTLVKQVIYSQTIFRKSSSGRFFVQMVFPSLFT